MIVKQRRFMLIAIIRNIPRGEPTVIPYNSRKGKELTMRRQHFGGKSQTCVLKRCDVLKKASFFSLQHASLLIGKVDRAHIAVIALGIGAPK